eukprot:6530361-Ditylum_brightwellii.AAC.2
MCVLNTKHNENSTPVRAKSRIVVLDNMEDRSWGKGEVYAPVIKQTQADCHTAFCHSVLPEDEIVIVCPPAGCRVSKSGMYWKLDKTLYESFKAIGLQSCPNAPCLFHGTMIPDQPPVYVGLYVDDFVYFSASDEIKHEFEHKLVKHGVSVDFMQTVNWFLGIQFCWSKTPSGGVRAHISQSTFACALIKSMELDEANIFHQATPYCSGFPIDAIPPNKDASQA